MKALVTVVFAASTLVGCQAKQSTSEVADSLHPDTYADVELSGPETHDAKKFYVFTDSADGFTVSVDKTSYEACFASQGYKVTKLGEQRFLVEVEPLAVPAVVCEPEMYTTIENGIDIEVPANEYGYNGAEILYLNRSFGSSEAKIETSAGDVSEESTVKLDIFHWFGRSAEPFTLSVDRHTVTDCGAPLFHEATELDYGYFVDINLAMRPAIPCRPDQTREIELGLDIKVEAGQDGYHWGRLITKRNPLKGDEPVKVVVKAEHETGDLENVDKVIECDLWAGDDVF